MKGPIDYPVKRAENWKEVETVSLAMRFESFVRTLRLRRRGRRVQRPKLTLASGATFEQEVRDPVLICIVRDAAKYLPSLLTHYRGLGVARFAFVDDQSRDETQAILKAQHDVDLFVSNVDFKAARGGNVWRDMLVDHYGRNRWYLFVDADEYLIYPGCEERPVSAFIKDLERSRLKRAHAAMIDIYPPAALGAERPSVHSDAFPAQTSPLHDGSHYTIGHEMFGAAVRGGPRQRLFGVAMRMSKFPLLYADRATQFAGGSHHGPLPLGRNFLPVHAVLLHHKFPAGAVADFQEIARRGTHSGKSAFYKQIVAQTNFSESTDLRYEGSQPFEDSERLIRDGFIRDLRDILDTP